MSLETRLCERLRGRVVVVGIGNPAAGDDAAGTLLAGLLSAGGDVRVIVAEDVPESHLGSITSWWPDSVLLIDAVDLGAETGAVALLRPDDITGRSASTHRVPLDLLGEVIERESSAEVSVLAIQPGSTAVGSPRSKEVTAAVQALATLLGDLLARQAPGPVDASAGRRERRC
ncbi:MAG: hydrogenase maturation protease [Acidobacteriota bacterium]